MSTLEIRGLKVSVDTENGPVEILKGVDLTIKSGETHAIMGPNGSGKSTLAYSIAGHPKYQITGGTVTLDGVDFGEVKSAMAALSMDPSFAERNVNEGFSGGEKKRHEIMQLELLKPKIAILDETDSGLDVDALRIVSEGVVRAKADNDLGVLLITHYTRILRYIKPDFVHVFADGRIVEEGGPELAEKLEANGYAEYVSK
ncbi:MAG: ABC transporter ATP-binding protein [Actinobacteria bacterium]|nr:ABC transporter ATP-binding protein [Actinomycetota bacterium]